MSYVCIVIFACRFLCWYIKILLGPYLFTAASIDCLHWQPAIV